MPKREARMVSLGYGKFVKADRVYALVPIEADDRGDGRRTYVHVEGLDQPIVASRSERAILTDVEAALTGGGRGIPAPPPRRGQGAGEPLLGHPALARGSQPLWDGSWDSPLVKCSTTPVPFLS